MSKKQFDLGIWLCGFGLLGSIAAHVIGLLCTLFVVNSAKEHLSNVIDKADTVTAEKLISYLATIKESIINVSNITLISSIGGIISIIIAIIGITVIWNEGAKTKAQEAIYCTHCGIENIKDAEYCKKCGKKIRES